MTDCPSVTASSGLTVRVTPGWSPVSGVSAPAGSTATSVAAARPAARRPRRTPVPSREIRLRPIVSCVGFMTASSMSPLSASTRPLVARIFLGRRPTWSPGGRYRDGHEGRGRCGRRSAAHGARRAAAPADDRQGAGGHVLVADQPRRRPRRQGPRPVRRHRRPRDRGPLPGGGVGHLRRRRPRRHPGHRAQPHRHRPGGDAKVVQGDALRFVEGLAPGDDAALRPGPCRPARMPSTSWPRLLAALPARLAVLETGDHIDIHPPWAAVRSRRHGDTVVTLVRRQQGAAPEGEGEAAE